MVFSSVDGYYNAMVMQCRYSSTLSDRELIQSYVFNKFEVMRYNSTVGKYVGYSEFGVHNAEVRNNNPVEMSRVRAVKDIYYKPGVVNEMNYKLTKKGE